MSWALFYYLIDVSINLTGMAIFVSIFLCLIPPFTGLATESWEKTTKIAKKCGYFLIVPVLYLTFVPDKQTLLVIAGLNMSQQPITEAVQHYSPKLKQLIDQELNKLLDSKEVQK